MLPKKFSNGKPEEIIQNSIISFMRSREWFVKPTIGNIYQSGFPDLYCSHRRYGQRWVEVKNPKQYAFTPAQIENFPLFCANGSGVWVLVAATDEEYKKLFLPPNWYQYLAIMK